MTWFPVHRSRWAIALARSTTALITAALVTAVVSASCATPSARPSATVRDDGRHRVRGSAGIRLDRRWIAPGPVHPQAIGADTHGAVAVGRYGEMSAVDRHGVEIWRHDVAGEGEQTVGPVAVAGGLVVAPVLPGRVVAVDRARGTERWRASVNRPGLVGVSGDGATAAVLTFGGTLLALDGHDGSLRWSTPLGLTPSSGIVSTAVSGGRGRGSVIVSWGDDAGLRVQAFDVESGRERWTVLEPRFGGAPAVSDSAVVLSENTAVRGRQVDGRVRALDPITGVERWSRDLPGPFLPDHRVLIRRGMVVVVDTAGALTALDADRGTARWTARTRRMQYAAAPLVAGRTVAMTTYGTGLAVVSAADGRRVANDHPGPVQLRVTFEGAATGGDGLYLLASRSRGGGEIWMLSASG